MADYTQDIDVVSAALLHDVIEDTEVTADDLRAVFGDRIAALVLEVTDVSKPEDGNRTTRKELDRLHLAETSPDGATIKLADLINNTASIVRHDKGFARLYLKEKEAALEVLQHGNADLWQRAYDTLLDAQTTLIHDKLAGN